MSELPARRLGTRIERLLARGDWSLARVEITRALAQLGDDHWLLSRLGLTYYEERDYRRALQFQRRALRMQPECPLVRWEIAGTLQMLGKHAEARAEFTALREKPLAKYAAESCFEGSAWVKGVKTDALFRLAKIAEERGQRSVAATYYRKFLRQRVLTRRSIYSSSDAQRGLKRLKDTDVA